ncbi:hypothetical protein GOP47_0008508 [Adiantum capillus-veneris]|uniref:Uncharacterized protein n=1 Tax=Adiantum capillus-veneris TaxID=13818 RepID=A0A9D4UZF8_ADICA|nr:hypothetical protein GOP47_0008508 [Adiantum capillus-veneris]
MVDLQGEGTGGLSADALALQAALAEVAECRTKLRALGEPPDHEAVDEAHFALSSIDVALASDLESLQIAETSSTQVQKESDMRKAAEIAKLEYQAIIDTYELYCSYELLLKAAEFNMMKLSGSPDVHLQTVKEEDDRLEDDQANEEVSRVLLAAKEGNIVDVKLSGCKLSRLPDAFGNVSTITSLDLSSNRLKLLPDSLGGLVELHTLNVERNELLALPDTIGLLKNLKVLNVTRNKLTSLPESISQCSGLEILDADLNELAYLPSLIGSSLPNLKQLSLRWNKLRSLPTSVCNLKSLRRLEVKFNYLKSLPQAIGNLTNLEYLDASCNFRELRNLPDTIGDLVSLVEIDLSCNQIKNLPESFGRLPALKKINLKDNPWASPPVEVAEAGAEAVMVFMKEKWQNFLEEEKQRHLAKESQHQEKWLPRTLSGLSRVFLGGSPRKYSSTEDYLEQQL